SGLMHRLVLYADGDISDNRYCDPCHCHSNATSCSNATLTMYDDSGCMNNPVQINATDNCASYVDGGTNAASQWFMFSADWNPKDCSPDAGSVSAHGSIDGANPTTICCP